MSAGIRNKAELLLALLYAAESPTDPAFGATPVEGITRLEKLLFLLKFDEGFLGDVPDKQTFHFVPFRMGPWTQEVYDEVDFLESLGLLTKHGRDKRSAADAAHDEELFSEAVLDKYQRTSANTDEESEIFTLTQDGKRKAKELWDRLPPEEKTRLIGVKRRFNNMNLKQLLRYVYKKYPEYTTASEIKQYLGIRED